MNKIIVIAILFFGFLFTFVVCDEMPFGEKSENAEENDHAIKAYLLSNKSGNYVTITNYGAKVMSIVVPDKEGKKGNVVLGYDSTDEYLNGNLYFGAIVGRYANRIAHGKFSLDGVTYQLNKNNGEHHLHGGPKGFHQKIWKAEKSVGDKGEQLTLTCVSDDGEESYPGKVNLSVTYVWTEDNNLIVKYAAQTDKKTIINLTHHSFFNLKDGGKSSIVDHDLMINANYFLPVDEGLIPTGEIRSVAGTPMDFRKSHAIADMIDARDEQLKRGRGYDHNFILNTGTDSLVFAAEVYEPTTGRVMQVFTDQPGLQFYSGNFLDGSDIGHDGTPYSFRNAFCLEAQHFPDSPNHPDFPSTILDVGDTYKQVTVYKFLLKQ